MHNQFMDVLAIFFINYKKWKDWTFNIQTMKECTQFFIFKVYTKFYIIIEHKIPKNVHNLVYSKPSKNAILYIQRRQFFK